MINTPPKGKYFWDRVFFWGQTSENGEHFKGKVKDIWNMLKPICTAVQITVAYIERKAVSLSDSIHLWNEIIPRQGCFAGQTSENGV